LGLPVVCTEIPAAEEIGGEEVTIFDADLDLDQLAEQRLIWADGSPTVRLRRQVRQSYTWDAIFDRDIRPLLDGDGAA
jgi:hypothetical protein